VGSSCDGQACLGARKNRATVKEVQGKSQRRHKLLYVVEWKITIFNGKIMGKYGKNIGQNKTPTFPHVFPRGFPPNFRPSNHTRGAFFTGDAAAAAAVATWHSITCSTVTIGQCLVATRRCLGKPAAPKRKPTSSHPVPLRQGAKPTGAIPNTEVMTPVVATPRP